MIEDAELARLKQELAGVATQAARLLTQPRYDEAELAELDARARELRERIRSGESPVRAYETLGGGRGMVSGG